jgi:hypothetical protein
VGKKDLYQHTITVGELIEKLKQEDPKRIVVMAKDSEGNSYSPLASFWAGAYCAENTWSGEVGFEKLTPEDEKDGFTEDDVLEGGRPAIILSPTN